MIIVFTNRALIRQGQGAGDETMFGEIQNAKGSNELRLAVATKDKGTGRWSLDLQEDKTRQKELPSQVLFRSVLAQVRAGSLSPKWVVAVHGYGQSFAASLEEAHVLEQRYQGERRDQQINVILFSWPSRPGGVVLEAVSAYRRAQAAAVPAAAALAIVLERVWSFFAAPALKGEKAIGATPAVPPVRDFSLCLLVHSQGNLVLETLARNKALAMTTVRLDTLILHQADVDASDHQEWVDRIPFANDVVITLNAWDAILRLSDAINPERLGIARSGFGSRATYFDFTGGRRVDKEHNLFLDVDNTLVRLFCQRALTGFPVHQMGGETNGFWFDSNAGTWRLGLRPSAPLGGAQRPGR
jgi:hypothetical protein